MRYGFAMLAGALLTVGAATLLFAQKPFQEYPGQDNIPLPPDYQEPHDWVWGRLRYADTGRRGGGFGGGFGGGGFRGRRGPRWGAWATDYSKGDRLLAAALKRLTLIDTRSVEQVIDLDGSDDVYNWPFLYAVEVGQWTLKPAEAKQLRDFLDRGGFLMVDDFHGGYEWDVFLEGIQQVFPDADIFDIPQDHQINNISAQLDQQLQIPGYGAAMAGRTYERADGFPGHWRAIEDQQKRLVVTIVHNSDLGDAVEYADDPTYPVEYSQQALRILSNYILYDLSH